MRRLDFLVIGAQKCATSWLYYCLREHPQLYLPAKKREIEYLGGRLFHEKGVDWYFSLFQEANSNQKIGDVSVEYIFDHQSSRYVHKYAPNAKFIVSLRNPIERAISAYYWLVRKAQIPSLTLEECFKEVIKGAQTNVLNNNSKYADILTRGFYDVQLEKYLQFFDIDRFLFLIYDDIENHSLAIIEQIYRYLNVDSSFCPSSLKRRPKQNMYIESLTTLEHLMPKSTVFYKFMEYCNAGLLRLGIRKKRPHLPQPIRQNLYQIYLPHIEKTQAIIQQARKENCSSRSDLSILWK